MGKFHNKEGKLCSDCQRCCMNGDVKKLTQLLASGCKVNARSDDGSTPLMVAASLGHADVVDTLLSSWNTDVNCQDLKGNTALMQACKAAHWKCVRSLLYSWSADLDKKDNTGSTALVLTTSCLSNKGHIRCVRLLVEQDADVNAKNDMGLTAVMYAVDSAELGLPLLKMLMEAGADVDAAIDYDGESLLMLAVRRRHLPILDHLIRFTDANVNSTNNSWDNALIIALKKSSVDESDKSDDGSQVVKYLMNAGSDPNSKSGTGCTALNIAAASSFENTVALLSNGAIPKLSQVYLCRHEEDNNNNNNYNNNNIHASLQACGSIFTPTDVAVLNGQFSTANFLLNFIGCRPYSLFDSYRTVSLNDHSDCAEPLKCAVDVMITKAHQCPGWIDMVRTCVSRPKTLLQFCMAVISKLAGASPGRHDRLIGCGLPPILVKKLFVLDFKEEEFSID